MVRGLFVALALVALLAACGTTSTGGSGPTPAARDTAAPQATVPADAIAPTPVGAAATETAPVLAPEPTPAPSPTTEQPTATLEPMAAPEESGGVLIVDVDKRAETVTLKNTGEAPVDLAGWKVLSVNGRQSHPISGVLQPGESKTFPGPGGNIWADDDQDPAELFNLDGEVVDTFPR